MADEPQSGSPRSDPVDSKEDAETAAARKELRHAAISENTVADSVGQTGRTTPEDDQEDDLKDRISSPKKKRARDQLDDVEAEELDTHSVASTDSAKDRALRSEPEKKRHRDELADESVKTTADTEKGSDTVEDEATTEKVTADISDQTDPKLKRLPVSEKEKTTSSSAFASSGFAKLASSSASPFGALGGSGAKKSVFGGSAAAASPFASASPQKPATPAATPTLSFGSAGEPAAASPFASAAPGANGFKSVFGGGGGFGSALAGNPLTSFAKPGASFKSEKPAKPFGAPESDAEDEDGDEDGDEEPESAADDKEAKEDSDKEDAKVSEEKKKSKLQRVAVDDGEAGEITVLAVRSKIYHLVKEEGWKERGAGMLKINVPESCVSFDDDGVPIPGSFDASGLEDDEEAAGGSKTVRLVMRQDSTHRILLNTIVFPALDFQEKASLKAVGVCFTAFEGEDAKPVTVQAKMSIANAKNFMSEIGLIQRELASA
ncbi:Nucleoporin NUP56 like protein [Verticillium longisporum]|uniref:RanBD1 domain-containing protein n=3 Tax=Verticillium TaxID=1036719 RepID=G2WS47_VERDV|nr:uncharacterized protein VDAG_00380 [Verticillium dahliae VdLs.17]KAF3350508.1 HD domain-containing protein C4G3.17 [Verticillium dahliae VDG2]KAF3354461.1 hypothetical protein VdG1_07540 [Verticillium dahliae VDG1]KAG7142415.1 Nucleoporin NUP56 like protein [Verticillium longisporum]KAH6710160.1 hypothetical protein EV126DRAFT_406655 [Verticillium dahliae]EGY13698.1 hypothetical protein VDAG_00380 [Verticillium dahliae VdLs.17]